ncbi:MAG TPA: ABC transporter permease [Candidatus Limnocylindrales bacterium]|nr:ABC transporter permease [Candidatus Limnocylindrales bacterium]
MTAVRARVAASPNLRIRLLQATGAIVFLVAWELAGAVAPDFYSQPTRILADFGPLVTQKELFTLVWDSTYSLLIGLAISLVVGVTIGMLVGRYRLFAVAVEPYLAAYYSIPRIAFVPLMVVWFGIEREFVIASVVAATTALLIIATSDGVRNSRSTFDEVARSFRISGRQMFTKILLPGSIPFIATGMRLGVQRALVGVIIAEYLVGLPGVGELLRAARITLNTDRIFSSAIVCTVMGVVLVLLTGFVERRFSRWRPTVF